MELPSVAKGLKTIPWTQKIKSLNGKNVIGSFYEE